MGSRPRGPSTGSLVSGAGQRRVVYTEEGPEPLVLDPRDSTRQYWLDSYSGVRREIWRPGDRDGHPEEDYYGRSGLPPPSARWRFYQVQTGYGPVSRKNMPPAYVVLDDLAAWEVDVSDIPRTTRAQFWSHDFAIPGYIRTARRHRGRGAVGDPDTEGKHRYYFGHTAVSSYDKHYFTGEQWYRPIVYIDPNLKRKADMPPTPDPNDKRVRGTMEYTPQKAVKMLGPSSSTKKLGHSTHNDPDPTSSPAVLRRESLMKNRTAHSVRATSPSKATQTMLTVKTTNQVEHEVNSNDTIFMDPGNVCSPYIPAAPSPSGETNGASKRIAHLNPTTPPKPDANDEEDDCQMFTFHSNISSPQKKANPSGTKSTPLRLQTFRKRQAQVTALESRTATQEREIADLKTRVTGLEALIEEWKAASVKLEGLEAWEAAM